MRGLLRAVLERVLRAVRWAAVLSEPQCGRVLRNAHRRKSIERECVPRRCRLRTHRGLNQPVGRRHHRRNIHHTRPIHRCRESAAVHFVRWRRRHDRCRGGGRRRCHPGAVCSRLLAVESRRGAPEARPDTATAGTERPHGTPPGSRTASQHCHHRHRRHRYRRPVCRAFHLLRHGARRADVGRGAGRQPQDRGTAARVQRRPWVGAKRGAAHKRWRRNRQQQRGRQRGRRQRG